MRYKDKSRNWKKGDKIICINNLGRQSDLTIDKEYYVLDCFIEYGVSNVQLIGDYYFIEVFSKRFKTPKMIRKEKLEKVEKLYEQME